MKTELKTFIFSNKNQSIIYLSVVDVFRKNSEKKTSTNIGFRGINRMVATYEQVKKRPSYFYPKRQIQDDGVHTKQLNL